MISALSLPAFRVWHGPGEDSLWHEAVVCVPCSWTSKMEAVYLSESGALRLTGHPDLRASLRLVELGTAPCACLIKAKALMKNDLPGIGYNELKKYIEAVRAERVPSDNGPADQYPAFARKARAVMRTTDMAGYFPLDEGSEANPLSQKDLKNLTRVRLTDKRGQRPVLNRGWENYYVELGWDWPRLYKLFGAVVHQSDGELGFAMGSTRQGNSLLIWCPMQVRSHIEVRLFPVAVTPDGLVQTAKARRPE